MPLTFSLIELGWTPDRDGQLEGSELLPARVAIQEREAYVIAGEAGETPAQVAGRFRLDAASPAGYPVVGDWVLVRPGDLSATIHRVLPRKTRISRKVAWERAEEQVLAANVDVVLVVSSLNADLNLRRLERYLAVARESGALPVVVLNKADLRPDREALVAAVAAVAGDARILVASAREGDGIDEIAAYLDGHRTVALLGSSGVGKSTITNRLLGDERLATAELRDDGRGRHTTTRRQLIVVPGRGLVLDTPGMRELQLWDADLEGAFADLTSLALDCRFRDCSHAGEPGCAVGGAIAGGALAAERLASYRKLERELASTLVRQDKHAMSEERKKWRVLNRRPKKPSGPAPTP